MTHDRLTRLWPAASVRVAAGDLELRWMDDDLLVYLAELAGRGIHPDEAMPFNVPWTRGSADDVARSVLTYQWSARSRVSPTALTLELGVLVAGEPVGIQSLSGTNWSVLREVETGSWLGREHQGRGIGTRMRALMLHVCFAGLGADAVTSGAFADNPASNAVSRRTGYEFDGLQRVVREGVAASQNRYRLTRERWDAVRGANAELIGADVELHGLDELRASLERG